jgi:ribonuclease HI
MRPALANFLIKPTKFIPLKKVRGLTPPSTVLLQTDGSFKHQMQLSRTACILGAKEGDYTLLNTYFEHRTSTESEWCSILDGIKFAIKKDQGSIHLENDNQGIINEITGSKKPPKLYYDYYNQIFKEIKVLDYIGMRWIPREMNRADAIFSDACKGECATCDCKN